MEKWISYREDQMGNRHSIWQGVLPSENGFVQNSLTNTFLSRKITYLPLHHRINRCKYCSLYRLQISSQPLDRKIIYLFLCDRIHMILMYSKLQLTVGVGTEEVKLITWTRSPAETHSISSLFRSVFYSMDHKFYNNNNNIESWLIYRNKFVI